MRKKHLTVFVTLVALFFGDSTLYASNKSPVSLSVGPSPLSVEPVSIKPPYFWQNSPKSQKRITEQRDILVSVKEHKLEKPGQKILKMQGVGMIHLSAKKAQAQALKFEQLPQVSGFIKKVVRLQPKERIFFHSKAFGYHAQMWILTQSIEPKINLIDESASRPGEIRFEIERGTFNGLIGSIRFVPKARNRTEVQFLATYKYKELPIPRLFVEYGLEVVIQKISARLRSHLESKNKNFI